jgi:hypothetical protein
MVVQEPFEVEITSDMRFQVRTDVHIMIRVEHHALIKSLNK